MQLNKIKLFLSYFLEYFNLLIIIKIIIIKIYHFDIFDFYKVFLKFEFFNLNKILRKVFVFIFFISKMS